MGNVARAPRAAQAGAPPTRRFRVVAHHGGFRPSIDPQRLNQLLDQLEAEDFARFAGLRWRNPLARARP